MALTKRDRLSAKAVFLVAAILALVPAHRPLALPMNEPSVNLDEIAPSPTALRKTKIDGAVWYPQIGGSELLAAQGPEMLPRRRPPLEAQPQPGAAAEPEPLVTALSPALIETNGAKGGHLGSNADTLRQVMRTIATIHPSDGQTVQALPRKPIRPYMYEDLGASQAADYVSELILDSEIAGSVLRAVTDIKSTDGQFTVFSVLGMGEFVLDASLSGHSFTISELSNGWSATLSGRGGASYMEYAVSGVGEGGSGIDKPNNFRLALNWLREFLFNPLALLMEMITALVLVLWIAARSVYHLQNHGSRSRR